MNREELKALGLTEEQIDKVMASHGKVVNSTKDNLDSVTTERDDLKTQLTDRDKQLEDLKGKAKGNDDLTAEIERLKAENSTTATEYQAKLDKQSFEFSLDKALTSAQVKNAKAVKALLDTEKIKLDGEKLLNLDNQLTALKESDPYLFAEEQQKDSSPEKPSFSTGEHGKGDGMTTADFSKMTYKERVQLKQDNPAEYSKLSGN